MTEQLIDNVSTTETAGIVLFKKKRKYAVLSLLGQSILELGQLVLPSFDSIASG